MKRPMWSYPTTRAEVAALRARAAADEVDAIVKLAIIYDNGAGPLDDGRCIRPDERRARGYWERAARRGDVSAITRVADFLSAPGHRPRELALAVRMYRRAFRRGDMTAADNLAATYMDVGRYREAVAWWRRAEAAGSSTASIEVARAELYGVGTRRNPRAAFERLEKLATERLGWNNWLRIEAMTVMADALFDGWLVPYDGKRAKAWRRAARTLDPADYDAKR